MIKDIMLRIRKSYSLIDELTKKILQNDFNNKNFRFIARGLTLIENQFQWDYSHFNNSKNSIVIGITGPGGSGKSCLLDEIISRFSYYYPEKKYAILSFDPTKRKSGGALLGDRIRMNSIYKNNIFMRSVATRERNRSISSKALEMINFLKFMDFDFIFIETAGIGQSDSSIVDYVDFSIYVTTPEYGASTQLEKIDMIDYADIIVINKFDKTGSLDALRDVRKQYRRSRSDFITLDEELPIFGIIASQYQDPATNSLFEFLVDQLNKKFNINLQKNFSFPKIIQSTKNPIIPENRIHYLREIKEIIENYHKITKKIQNY